MDDETIIYKFLSDHFTPIAWEAAKEGDLILIDEIGLLIDSYAGYPVSREELHSQLDLLNYNSKLIGNKAYWLAHRK